MDIGFSCRIPVSDLRRNQTINVGRILESDISTIPEFSQCVDIGFFLSDTSIRPTSKPKNPCGSDSRIRHSNHSRIFSMCGHRLFCRIPVSDLRRNRTIYVGRILESDISIIPKFPRCVNIGFSCRIPVSDLRRNRTINVGRALESDISIIPEFLQCVNIGLFVGYEYPTYVKTPPEGGVCYSSAN